MSKIYAKWIEKDVNTLEANGTELRVKVDSAGAIESSASGLDVKNLGIDTDRIGNGAVTESKVDPVYRAELIRRDGSVAFNQNQSMGNKKLTNLSNGTDANDAINLSQLDSAITGISWRTPADEAEVASANISGSVVAGYRILVNGVGVGDFAGHDNNIATRNEANDGWDFTSPVDNWAIFEKELDQAYTFAGSVWVQFTGAGQINAGNGLTKNSNTIDVVGDASGAINVNANDISVSVDNSTIEISGTLPGELQVKNEGLTANKLNSNVAGNGIVLDVISNAINVNVDDSTVEVHTNNTIRVKADGIGANELDESDSYDFASAFGGIRVATKSPSDNSTFAASTAYVDAAVDAAGETRTQELFLVNSTDVSNGYVSLSHTPISASSVSVFPQHGTIQINKQIVGSTGATPDFDVLNNNQVHINNNGAATALSSHITAGDIINVIYSYNN